MSDRAPQTVGRFDHPLRADGSGAVDGVTECEVCGGPVEEAETDVNGRPTKAAQCESCGYLHV
jgi:hypothetical protein